MLRFSERAVSRPATTSMRRPSVALISPLRWPSAYTVQMPLEGITITCFTVRSRSRPTRMMRSTVTSWAESSADTSTVTSSTKGLRDMRAAPKVPG